MPCRKKWLLQPHDGITLWNCCIFSQPAYWGTQEKACTSVLRKRGVPGNKEVAKESVMRITLISSDQKEGIPPALYDARLNFNQIKNVPSMLKSKPQLLKINRNIGFAHVIPDTPVFDDNSLTKYGLQLLGSPLSYQLPPMDINFSI